MPDTAAPDSAAERYFRRGFGLKSEIKSRLNQAYHSELVDEIRKSGHVYRRGGVTIRLAREFGFCYGVDRAVEYAYETLEKFPDRRIYLANEIIHNPHVNEELRARGVRFLHESGHDYERLRVGDVVVIPAFGVNLEEMNTFQNKGCLIVDTTCGSVINVWKNVERYAQDGFTSLIHGKASHEETKATCSRLSQFPEARFVVVRNFEEARFVCRYILEGGDEKEFFGVFRGAVSVRFDPNRDLERIGVANQTTMLSSESIAIAAEVKASLSRKFGDASLESRFRNMDTICSATQERQDAVLELMRTPVDLVIVIGGYNSSNTNHLIEITVEAADGRIPAYHIDDPSCLLSLREIRHKPVGKSGEITSTGWLPPGPVTIGVTAGASTPNNKIGEIIERILELKGLAASVAAPAGNSGVMNG